MGPFPHDALPPTISAQNPMGTDGFAFVEFVHPEPAQLHRLFRLMGFVEVARHCTKAISVYRQGDIDYLVNEEPNTHAERFAVLHGPCASSMGAGSQVLEVPAFKGIGGSLPYLVDRYGSKG
jgi:4-hydroxyphenylpyruvate dioxygenase